MTHTTAVVGTSADTMASIAALYLKDGWTVADVTYGRGVFWRSIDTSRFDFRSTDISTDGTDFRQLPYETATLDAIVLDPPYMPSHDGVIKESMSTPYRLNETTPRSIASVTALYFAGIVEAQRVIRPRGVLVVKCQDTIENHKRHWTHIDIQQAACAGEAFAAEDLFVLQRAGRPAMRQEAQTHARSNHSYFWVFRRLKRPW